MPEVNLIRAKNPRWGDEDKTFIIVDCEFKEYAYLGLHGFMAAPYDVEPHGRMIFELAKRGKFGTVKPFAEVAR